MEDEFDFVFIYCFFDNFRCNLVFGCVGLLCLCVNIIIFRYWMWLFFGFEFFLVLNVVLKEEVCWEKNLVIIGSCCLEKKGWLVFVVGGGYCVLGGGWLVVLFGRLVFVVVVGYGSWGEYVIGGRYCVELCWGGLVEKYWLVVKKKKRVLVISG